MRKVLLGTNGWMAAVWVLWGGTAFTDASQASLPSRSQAGLSERVALLDDALPGHDRAANARLAGALADKGFEVTRLTADQLLASDALAAQRFSVLVLTHCGALPAGAVRTVDRLAREGVHTFCIGGPFADRSLWRVDGRW
ncbi:MAG TPA: hypothetical protein PLT74_05065, partial [Kiritimatiellia bacterium]|nr:hypothetical protein [Kiritimatiellia bacterium]